MQCYGVVSQNIQTTTNFIVCAINDVDTTGFWDSNGSDIGIYWFAFGKQQWGCEITFTAKTIVFPCPYAEILPSVIGSSSGSSAKLAINANSLISFNASNQAAQTIWWIAIGKQQWGDTTVSMPLLPAEAFNIAIWDDSNITHVGFDISSLYGRYFICSKQQWGLYLNTKTDRIHVPFNIPGTTFFNGLACYTDVSGGADIGIDVTLSNGQEIVVIIDSNKIVNFNFLWLAILKQQWGSYLESQSDTDYRHFSIAYTKFYKIALGNVDYSVSEPVYGYTPYFQEVNSNTFLIGYGNNREGYGYVPLIAIGQQQWGYGDALKWPGLTIELPIPFSNSVYATVAMGCPTTYFWDYPAQIKLNGLTEISYGVQQGVSEDKMFWLIIGQ